MPDARLTRITSRIADSSGGLGFDDIPPSVVTAAKDHLLDALGVGLAAASFPSASRLERAVRMMGAGEESTALGFPVALPAPSAALLNGMLVHSLEFDDTHVPSVVHGSSVVVPAALAVAERERATGRDLVRAVVLGWELLARLGLAAPGRFQAHGFQITAVGGPFAAALVGALLLALDRDEAISAMGIAGSQSSGVFAPLAEGATSKSLHPGWAAHAGVIAAYLAQGGMTGPAGIFEGQSGFFGAYARTESAAGRLHGLLDDLGRVWCLPEAAFKAYPCCHYVHPFLECLERLVHEGLRADEVESVRCDVPVEEVPIICEPWGRKLSPSSGYEAKFSLPYCLAALLLDGEVGVSTFDERCPRDAVLSRVGKIGYRPLAGTEFPRRFPGRVEVRTRSGRTLAASVDDVKGGPERPLPASEIRRKFESNALRRLSPDGVRRVMSEVERIEEAADLGSLSAALRSPRA
jgi:2-methylcitrate dehydratase PrpD